MSSTIAIPEAITLTDTRLGFARTWDDVVEMMEWLKKPRDVLAVDSETSGFDPFAPGARIRLVQFGDVNEAWTLDAERWPGLVQHILETYPGEIAFHNAGFDMKWFAAHYPGIKLPWSRTTDTMILARIDPELHTAKLKDLGSHLWGPAAAMGETALHTAMKNNGWEWDTVPMELPAYSQYAALDCILTARLYRHLEHFKRGQTARIVSLEHEVRRIANGMELRGFRVDRPYCEEKWEELGKFIDHAQQFCKDKYGVSIGSNQQLAKWFEAEGVELSERTANGALSMSKDVLEVLAPKYELADMALKSRKSTKIRSAYFENILKFSEADGRAHCQIQTMEARTGRMSIKDPALQTLPSKGEGAMVRKAFLPTEGHVIYSADYSSIESRLAAHFGEDDNMVEAFRVVDEEGGDFFVELGKKIWDPDFKKSDPRRAVAKVIVYSGLYGAGVSKMAATAGVSEAEMSKIRDEFFESFPAIKACQKLFSAEAEANYRKSGIAYVTSTFGRDLRIDPDKIYTAANYKIQSHAAEILKQAIVNCDMLGIGDWLALPIHDELVLDVPATEDPVEVIATLREAMEVTPDMGYRVPLPISPEGPMDRWDSK